MDKGAGAGRDAGRLVKEKVLSVAEETTDIGVGTNTAEIRRARRQTAPTMDLESMRSKIATRQKTGQVLLRSSSARGASKHRPSSYSHGAGAGQSGLGLALLEELEHVTDRWSSSNPMVQVSLLREVEEEVSVNAHRGGSGAECEDGLGGAAQGGADIIRWPQGEPEIDSPVGSSTSPSHPKRTSFSDTWTTSALTYTTPGRDSSLLQMALVTATEEEVKPAPSSPEDLAMQKLAAMRKPGLKGWSAIRAVVRPVEGLSQWGALLTALHKSSSFPSAAIPDKVKKPQEWKQLAGHADNFAVPEDPRFILKKKDAIEEQALTGAMADPNMTPFVVPYYGTVDRLDESTVAAAANGSGDGSSKEWMKMGNLLHGFVSPSLMDIKMGQRTYLHNKSNTKKKRLDLLEKMMKVDPTEATEEEKREGITKLRYMRFREMQSSTAELGFRIEAMHVSRDPAEGPQTSETAEGSSFSKYFVPKSRAGVEDEIKRFLKGSPEAQRKFVIRLREMRERLPTSAFFARHEVIGSSLLLVYDRTGNASISMLDFAKTMPSETVIKHDVAYVYPSTSPEDGYLLGLGQLLEIVESVDVGPDVSESVDGDTKEGEAPEIANAILV